VRALVDTSWSSSQRQFNKARRYGLVLSLLMVDADHFKNVNDQYGHASGERVLQALSRAASSSVRAVDVVARYGSEEFVVLLPLTAAADALQVAERMRASIEALQIGIEGGSSLRVTVSVGCATCAGAACSLGTLLSQADKALYRAKASGRNQVVCDLVT
jgi:diguanylate cyclase (GGDEF)-like protein